MATVLAGAIGIGPALADGYEAQVLEKLERQGFRDISTERTWLGRTRIVAVNGEGQREIVMNPNNGEILRDLWLYRNDDESERRVASSGSDSGSSSSSGSTGTSSSSAGATSSGSGEASGSSGSGGQTAGSSAGSRSEKTNSSRSRDRDDDDDDEGSSSSGREHDGKSGGRDDDRSGGKKRG